MNRLPQKSTLTKWETKMAEETLGLIYKEEGHLLGQVTILDLGKLLQKWINGKAQYLGLTYFTPQTLSIYENTTPDNYPIYVDNLISKFDKLQEPTTRNHLISKPFMRSFYQTLSTLIAQFIRLSVSFSPECTYWAICKKKNLQKDVIAFFQQAFPEVFRAFAKFRIVLQKILIKFERLSLIFDISLKKDIYQLMDNHRQNYQIQVHDPDRIQNQEDPQNDFILDIEDEYERLQNEGQNDNKNGEEEDKKGEEEDKNEQQEDQNEQEVNSLDITLSEISEASIYPIIYTGNNLEMDFNFLYDKFKQLLMDNLEETTSQKILYANLIHYNTAMDNLIQISNEGLSDSNGYFAQSQLFKEITGIEFYKYGDHQIEMDEERQQYQNIQEEDMEQFSFLDSHGYPLPNTIGFFIIQYPNGELEFQTVTSFAKGNIYLIGEDQILDKIQDKDGEEEDRIREEQDQIMVEEEDFRRQLGIQEVRQDKVLQDSEIDE